MIQEGALLEKLLVDVVFCVDADAAAAAVGEVCLSDKASTTAMSWSSGALSFPKRGRTFNTRQAFDAKRLELLLLLSVTVTVRHESNQVPSQ